MLKAAVIFRNCLLSFCRSRFLIKIQIYIFLHRRLFPSRKKKHWKFSILKIQFCKKLMTSHCETNFGFILFRPTSLSGWNFNWNLRELLSDPKILTKMISARPQLRLYRSLPILILIPTLMIWYQYQYELLHLTPSFKTVNSQYSIFSQYQPTAHSWLS